MIKRNIVFQNAVYTITLLLLLLDFNALGDNVDDEFDEEFDDADAICQNESMLRDPFEKRNRAMHNMHEKLDTNLLKPVAKRYYKSPLHSNAVHNFLENLEEPHTMLNSILQLNPRQFFRATARFMLNSTFGIFGAIDFAAKCGVPRKKSTFNNTLEKWRFKRGQYVFIPGIGPRTSRGTLGFALDIAFSPLKITKFPIYHSLSMLKLLHTRAAVLPLTDKIDKISIDKYSSIKTMYEQSIAKENDEFSAK